MYKNYFKRIIDLLLAIILLPLVIVLLIIVSPLIFIEDKGSIFYTSMRLGKKREIFKMYKLRTMKADSPDLRNEDGSTFNSEKDVRLTKIGRILRKTSIDEIPQIFNIILGDMSFIGPRPDLPEHLHFYKNNEIKKLEVLPGITGYNQAYFRNSIEWRERLQNDLYYVINMSFRLDVKIFFVTIINTVFVKNIFLNNSHNHVVK